MKDREYRVKNGRNRYFKTLEAAKAYCDKVFKRSNVVLGIEKCEEKLKSFHFSCGNSSKGPIGFCARIKAHTKQEALEILKEGLPAEFDLTDGRDDNRWEYLEVYFNEAAVSTRHIDEVDDCEKDGEEEEDGSTEANEELQALPGGKG